MNSNSDNGKNGYLEMIRKGISAVQSFDSCFSSGIGSRDERIERLKTVLESAEAIVIGAGAGLSASAGLMYSGERFHRYFFDFEKAFGRRATRRRRYYNGRIECEYRIFEENARPNGPERARRSKP